MLGFLLGADLMPQWSFLHSREVDTFFGPAFSGLWGGVVGIPSARLKHNPMDLFELGLKRLL